MARCLVHASGRPSAPTVSVELRAEWETRASLFLSHVSPPPGVQSLVRAGKTAHTSSATGTRAEGRQSGCWPGLSRAGLSLAELDRTGQDWTGLDWIGRAGQKREETWHATNR